MHRTSCKHLFKDYSMQNVPTCTEQRILFTVECTIIRKLEVDLILCAFFSSLSTERIIHDWFMILIIAWVVSPKRLLFCWPFTRCNINICKTRVRIKLEECHKTGIWYDVEFISKKKTRERSLHINHLIIIIIRNTCSARFYDGDHVCSGDVYLTIYAANKEKKASVFREHGYTLHTNWLLCFSDGARKTNSKIVQRQFCVCSELHKYYFKRRRKKHVSLTIKMKSPSYW